MLRPALPAAAMKGVVTPETVDEDAYDVELATGTAVDGATNVDDDDPALTSPHWSRIAEIMDCKFYSSTRAAEDRARS